ncbi:putative signal transduction histidine kinase [Sediminispirochaeta smaragdinae DSM 11293]|uniref:histidine kinase n=2 Tax=Sediminispirochaeta TaxID=1911556 RepID=E1RBG1_SEDSS|nr:putative signal transduction histidine kinase [Sediminispirochaeta smaragdinae DSM 11293]
MGAMHEKKMERERLFAIFLIGVSLLSHMGAGLFFGVQEQHVDYLRIHWHLPFYLLLAISAVLSILINLKIDSGKKQVILLIDVLLFFLIGYPLGPHLDIEIILGINLITILVFSFSDLYGEKIALIIIVVTLMLQAPYSLWFTQVPAPSMENMIFAAFILVVFTLFLSILKRVMNRLHHEEIRSRKYNRALDELTNNSFDYQHISRQNAMELIRTEKQYITREVHDIISYAMTNQLMLVQAAMSIKDKNSPVVDELLEKAKNEINGGMSKTRAALGELRDQEFDQEDVNLLVEQLIAKFKNFSHIDVQFRKDEFFSRLPRAYNQTIFHIIQQCMTNTYLHSSADTIEILCEHEGRCVVVVVKDNGTNSRGFREGIGIKGMRERIEMLGGVLKISALSLGFTVRAEIPIAEG